MAKIIGVQTRERGGGDCRFYPANLSIRYIQFPFDPPSNPIHFPPITPRPSIIRGENEKRALLLAYLIITQFLFNARFVPQIAFNEPDRIISFRGSNNELIRGNFQQRDDAWKINARSARNEIEISTHARKLRVARSEFSSNFSREKSRVAQFFSVFAVESSSGN